MNITIKHMRYFTALSETLNFGRAAERMHVSQPALSQQIKELETQLGAKLVERQPRRVVLTPAGHTFLRHARKILAELKTLEAASRWRTGLGGRLTLGVIPTVAPYLLPVALPLLRAHDMQVDLGIREARTERLLSELAEGRLDAAVMALPSGASDLVEVPLFEDRFLLAGTARTLPPTTDHLVPTQLNPERLLLLEEGHCLADQALEVCALKRTDTRIDLGASSLATLCGLAAAGFGLTFLPEIALKTETAAAPELCTRRFDGTQPKRTIGLVRRKLSNDDGWFTELADLLETAGSGLVRR